MQSLKKGCKIIRNFTKSETHLVKFELIQDYFGCSIFAFLYIKLKQFVWIEYMEDKGSEK